MLSQIHLGIICGYGKGDKSKTYTVKSPYRILNNNLGCLEDMFFTQLWVTTTSPDAKHFIWRLGRNRIATMVNLENRGILLSSVLCQLCQQQEESTQHPFIESKIASTVWNW